MSLQPDGTYRCNGCGADLSGGSAQECAVIVTVQRGEPSIPVAFRLCRVPRDGAPDGCEGNLIGATTLANWTEGQGM